MVIVWLPGLSAFPALSVEKNLTVVVDETLNGLV